MCEPCDRMRVGLPSAPTASVIGPASVVTSTSRSGPSVLTGEILRVGGQRHAQQPQRMVELLGPAVGGHRGRGARRRAVGADVVGDLAVHALDLRLRLRPLEVGEVRRPRLRRAHPRPVDLDLALEGADREGLAGQPGPQVLAEVVLRAGAVHRQYAGRLDARLPAQRLGGVVDQLLLGRAARAGRRGGHGEDERDETADR